MVGTLTLNGNFTGSISVTYHGISLEQATPWTEGVLGPQSETIPITWNPLQNGLLNITDGTPNLNINFAVGVGFRVLTYAGVSDDNTVDLIVATRLQ
jgi:hypothetical protein